MNPDKQIPNRIPDEKGRMVFPPGVSGNPAGRPKEKTIKERVREWLEEHPEDMQGFVKHFVKKNKELAWQMLEGRPPQDVTSAGEKINPQPIIDLNVYTNDSDKENTEIKEKD